MCLDPPSSEQSVRLGKQRHLLHISSISLPQRGHRHLTRLMDDQQPTGFKKLVNGLTGQGGTKVFALFYWVNSALVCATYALRTSC